MKKLFVILVLILGGSFLMAANMPQDVATSYESAASTVSGGGGSTVTLAHASYAYTICNSDPTFANYITLKLNGSSQAIRLYGGDCWQEGSNLMVLPLISFNLTQGVGGAVAYNYVATEYVP